MMVEVREYIDGQGRNHFRRWTSKLDASVRARVDTAVFRLGEGNFSAATGRYCAGSPALERLQEAKKAGELMALTRSFRESVVEELREKDYRRAFLGEAINDMLAGDLDSAKMVLREYINGTVGFIKAGKALLRSPKSLMRMLSTNGNPQARNLLELVAYLQKVEGTIAEVRLTERAA